jgi:hypothetical protein
MTSFTLAGGFKGRYCEISWINGLLSGDTELVEATERWLKSNSGYLVPAGNGVSSSHNHQGNPYVAYDLMKMLLQDPDIVSGELPPTPDPSEE